MFRKRSEQSTAIGQAHERVDSVLGAGVAWQGQISGTGGVRIEGAFDGKIALRGLVVISERGRVTCEHIRAMTVIVAGSVKGDITTHKLEITRTGRVWGDVVAASFSTEEGAFLRGKITMEEQVDLGLGPEPATEGDDETSPAEGVAEPSPEET